MFREADIKLKIIHKTNMPRMNTTQFFLIRHCLIGNDVYLRCCTGLACKATPTVCGAVSGGGGNSHYI
jgi:hypothetical protein